MSLTIHEGQHTAILGPNGSGKSSLLRVLTFEDRPVASADGAPVLRLFGRDRWDVTELRARLGVVTGELDATFGSGTSHGRVTGHDVTLSGLLGSHGVFAHHHVTAAMRARASGALERVGALHLAERPLNELSAGERRRILIARALIAGPRALLLDEPTSGLDLVARHRFMESIRLLANGGTTVVLITHHVDEIIPEIQRVVLLQNGRVACDAPPHVALTPKRLSLAFGAPLMVERIGEYRQVRLAASRSTSEGRAPRGSPRSPALEPRTLTPESQGLSSKRPTGHGFRLSAPFKEGHMAKYGKSASKNVERTMRRRKKGTLKSSSGRKVTSRKQAIAIGLSEAREKGAKVPSPRGGRKSASSGGRKRASGASKGTRKGTKKKAARKK
jgi:iron complex transport system ATP-binding protein